MEGCTISSCMFTASRAPAEIFRDRNTYKRMGERFLIAAVISLVAAVIFGSSKKRAVAFGSAIELGGLVLSFVGHQFLERSAHSLVRAYAITSGFAVLFFLLVDYNLDGVRIPISRSL